ncbi:DUF4350 domain-containing protein [Halovivax gelatinilyticus]|uniref:DUF4350 domain-containing protein n=1 Tax=Halovivax gelatinilyticus TaxID=2961597 RepID=UPI0020CA4401|nr:DUF4350 domain-containing protein [Halovivax gelatinilyticus]
MSDGPVVSWLRRLVRGEVAWPRVLLSGLGVTVVVALVVLLATSTAAFGAYNPGWEGSSDFRSALEAENDVEMAQSTSVYDEGEPDGTVAFVVAPTDHYAGEDAERLARFVDAGGTLVVFENFGTAGNALLTDVGAQARFDGELLRDEREYSVGPAMPVASVEGEHPATEGVEALALNYATAIEPNGATVVAETSPYAYLGPADADLDEVELGSYPVATVESVGDGTVIAVADPSVTINAMFDEEDNAAFLTGLADERAIIDVSHAESLPPLWAAVLTVRGSSTLALLVGLGLIGTLAIAGRNRGMGDRVLRAFWGRLRPGGQRPEPEAVGLSPAERAALVRERNPEWSDERVRRSITALNRSEREGERE